MSEEPTELQIAECLCAIFAALEGLHIAGMRDGRASKVRRESVHFLWELREGGKLSAERPHSAAAWDFRQGGGRGGLQYEHSVPVAVFMPILRAASRDPHSMLAALKRYVRPVIVTDEEARSLAASGLNHSLPAGVDLDDWAARYRQAGIALREQP